MQSGTDKGKKKLAAVVAAVAIVVFLALYFGAPAAALLGFGEEVRPVLMMMSPAVLVGIAVVVGIVIVLFQRLREIDKGEEDEAQKY